MTRARPRAGALCRAWVAAGLWAIAALLPGTPARAQLLSGLEQLSFDFVGSSVPFSEWGRVELSYLGASQVQYFNLNIAGNWALQNIPVFSREGPAINQTTSFSFNLGNSLLGPGFSRGTSLVGGTAPSGFSLTAAPLGTPPPVTAGVPINGGLTRYGAGLQAQTILLPPAALQQAGGAVQPNNTGAHRNFPNQETGDNECVPAAVSNSLMFLRTNNPGAGWGTLPVDIAAMKTATGWTAQGAPVNWSTLKRQYMNNHGYPIMTMDTTSFTDILDAIRQGKDVELSGGWHAAAIVGIADLGGGRWSLDVAHDTSQGMPGGTVTETITWNPTTMRFSGSPGFFDGSIFRYATIEMIPAPGAAVLLMLAALGSIRRRR